MFSLLFAIISLLYTTVGQAGGTACLALMAFVARPPTEMRPTALALNIVVAAYSTWAFNRSKVIDWIMLRPLLRMPTHSLMALTAEASRSLSWSNTCYSQPQTLFRAGGMSRAQCPAVSSGSSPCKAQNCQRCASLRPYALELGVRLGEFKWRGRGYRMRSQ